MLAVTDKEQIEACLLDIIGSVIKADSYKYRCRKCKTQMRSWEELDRHHIIYRPKRLVWLCRRCHCRVTYLNGMKAREVRRKLDNKLRWEVWHEFLKEKTTEEEFEKSERIVEGWFA